MKEERKKEVHAVHNVKTGEKLEELNVPRKFNLKLNTFTFNVGKIRLHVNINSSLNKSYLKSSLKNNLTT